MGEVESRITGGRIEDIVSKEKVERLGFCSMHPTSSETDDGVNYEWLCKFERGRNSIKRSYGKDRIIKLGVRFIPQLSKDLKNAKLYFANAQIHPENDFSLSGDLYREKEENEIFKGFHCNWYDPL